MDINYIGQPINNMPRQGNQNPNRNNLIIIEQAPPPVAPPINVIRPNETNNNDSRCRTTGYIGAFAISLVAMCGLKSITAGAAFSTLCLLACSEKPRGEIDI